MNLYIIATDADELLMNCTFCKASFMDETNDDITDIYIDEKNCSFPIFSCENCNAHAILDATFDLIEGIKYNFNARTDRCGNKNKTTNRIETRINQLYAKTLEITQEIYLKYSYFNGDEDIIKNTNRYYKIPLVLIKSYGAFDIYESTDCIKKRIICNKTIFDKLDDEKSALNYYDIPIPSFDVSNIRTVDQLKLSRQIFYYVDHYDILYRYQNPAITPNLIRRVEIKNNIKLSE